MPWSGCSVSWNVIPSTQKFVGSIPSQETHLRCGFDPLAERLQEATDWCFSLFKMSKRILEWGFLKNVYAGTSILNYFLSHSLPVFFLLFTVDLRMTKNNYADQTLLSFFCIHLYNYIQSLFTICSFQYWKPSPEKSYWVAYWRKGFFLQ